MKGYEVRKMIVDSGLRLWQVAGAFGCNDGNFSRRLRKEFDDNEVEKIQDIINQLKGRRNNKTKQLFDLPKERSN